jgi:hypothetical protein
MSVHQLFTPLCRMMLPATAMASTWQPMSNIQWLCPAGQYVLVAAHAAPLGLLLARGYSDSQAICRDCNATMALGKAMASGKANAMIYI